MSRRALTSIITIVVATVWSGTGVDAIASHNSEPFDVATTVMLVVVGFYMATTRKNGD